MNIRIYKPLSRGKRHILYPKSQVDSQYWKQPEGSLSVSPECDSIELISDNWLNIKPPKNTKLTLECRTNIELGVVSIPCYLEDKISKQKGTWKIVDIK